MNKWFVPLIAMMVLSSVVGAEGGCPPGQYPYETPQARQCVPIPGANASSPGAPAQYATRWGAVATDGPKGILGSTNGAQSKRAAVKTALAECAAKGGSCKLQLAYQNQCAVLVTGDREFLVQSAESIDVASELALRACSTTDTNCRVHYSGCSFSRAGSVVGLSMSKGGQPCRSC